MTQSAVVKDVHVGDEIAYGPVATAYYAVLEFLQIRPFYSMKSGYGFETRFGSYGKASFVEVWSFGKQLDYSKGVSQKRICFQAPCLIEETGLVLLGEADFRAAAQNGFAFAMVGKLRRINGKVSAQAFGEVLKLKGQLAPALSAVQPPPKPYPDLALELDGKSGELRPREQAQPAVESD
ncbi:hypothetical protein [Phyllobacterium endophyticum]|uniref:Uncharacterized protein n=2 Tax=Phyllobacterium endophyticum TaxID=1149773 RepID=A0A2P7AU78_9HYPH|nr:hypothetical protein [Phyllobacterium endophyticum]MBB3234217.1 hypothetical protein [Phyllobacterium endophyticum]PSH57768.1 hypothetical protein CU100_08605 [Phyllobacterium endophyticum]TYR43967.1 hypothetical protein FY050_01975 [Phyllobacterium endophyticum]